MNGGIQNASVVVEAIDTIEQLVPAGGANAWLDTDLTATALGTWSGSVVIVCTGGAGQSGAREPGSVAAPLLPGGGWVATFVVKMAAGHIELYQNMLAQSQYEIIGKII